MTFKKEVKAMVDLLPCYAFLPEFSYLEPAVGSGNFLIEVLKRKIKKSPDCIKEIISSLYGIDILDDNVKITRKRIYDEISTYCSNSLKKEIKEILNKNIICGDFLKYKFKKKFDCILTNPPYHTNSSGKLGSSATIYQYFVQKAKRMSPEFILMIIPSKWMSQGRGLKKFRSEMLCDKHIKVLYDFINAKEIFPDIFLRGGVCYFLRDKNYKGKTLIKTHLENGEILTSNRFLKEKDIDIFIRYEKAISILKKVQLKKENSIKEFLSSECPFGLRTFYRGNKIGSIKVYTNKGTTTIDEKLITKNRELINQDKVLIPRAIGLGGFKGKINAIYSEPKSICTETYIVFSGLNSKKEAENAIKYINTKFFKFLLGLKKNTMMAPKNTYSFIPMQDFKKEITDEMLFKKYELDEDEIGFINQFF